jgi:hypothetical protein
MSKVRELECCINDLTNQINERDARIAELEAKLKAVEVKDVKALIKLIGETLNSVKEEGIMEMIPNLPHHCHDTVFIEDIEAYAQKLKGASDEKN